MRKILLPTILLLSTFACTNLTQNQSKSSSGTIDTVKKINPIDTLKKLNDIKMALLDARPSKAELFLGKPDKTGTLNLGRSEYIIYFDKVNDGDKIKNLVLITGDNDGDYANYKIKDVMAISNGGRAYYGYHNIKIDYKKQLSSNCTTFTIDN